MTNNAFAGRTASNMLRAPKGVPTGGQFAGSVRTEAPIKLGSTEGTGALEEFTDTRELLNIAYDSSDHWIRRYGQAGKSNTIDLDDIAQTTVLQVLEDRARGKEISNVKQYVNSVSANNTVRATANVFRAEDRRAYRRYTEKVENAERMLDRSLTQNEKDKLAQQVLEEWEDRRHMPSKDFRTPITVDISLDRPSADGEGVESTLGATLMNPELSDNYIEPDSFMDKAFTASETTGAAHKAEMKRLAWNAIAERAQVPLSNEGSLSQRQVTKHRNVMSDHADGVMGACRDWSNGDDNEATEALFAPFGEIDFEDQEKVVSMLERVDRTGEGRASEMWQSAIAFANNKHAKN